MQFLREKSRISREGVSLQGISEAAEAIGFRTLGAKLAFEKFAAEAPLPCIAHWNQDHFVVVYKIQKKELRLFSRGNVTVQVADPSKGLTTYTREEFLDGWLSSQRNGQGEGVVLLLEPSPEFHEAELDEKRGTVGFSRLFGYLFAYKKLLIQLVLGLLAGSILQMVFPFLTQSIVDVGVNTQNLNFIYVVLAAQLMLFAGRTSVEFIRSWILLHISTRINISILSDFLIKLMRLPLSFFDVKLFGDLMQRISDHHRIEVFLTNTSLITLFSLFNIIIFGAVLAYYQLSIFLIFLAGSVMYVGWVVLFMKQRRSLDHKRFHVEAKNQSGLVQLIQGMQEIKLANSETQMRWEWERIQAKLFQLSLQGLALNQYQQAGLFFFNEGKNILITFLAAKSVIEGDMTLGAMLAVQYIIGQLNSPVEQLILFMQTAQDAKISLERLNEIHQMDDEEPANRTNTVLIPDDKSFYLKNVTFSYPGTANAPVLKDITLHIPQGRTTAVVGMSGSGKTTLLKLLLRFYQPDQGEIRLGEANLSYISHKSWRSKCGVVMQDGFIFSDTIARNIAVGDEHPNVQRLMQAVEVAQIRDFIESLPLGYNTKIGMEGNGISQGQRQRILIARAVYKDPSFLFFDEATNALDANNESTIMSNLEAFFLGRTVVVVAHRLSTVKNAHQIVVIDKGRIVEQGTHAELTSLQGNYYRLVKNQLELGN